MERRWCMCGKIFVMQHTLINRVFDYHNDWPLLFGIKRTRADQFKTQPTANILIKCLEFIQHTHIQTVRTQFIGASRPILIHAIVDEKCERPNRSLLSFHSKCVWVCNNVTSLLACYHSLVMRLK